MLTFEKIFKASQHKLKKMLLAELSRMGYRIQTKKGFLYAKGRSPILLVAHLDTVHKEPVKTICYSADGHIVMSPEGIGGDDRAGVLMILQIIKKHRCHVLFCEDEETGGVGAHAFAESDLKPEVNYIVELDRRSSDDAVFYDCDNPEFTKFVTRFGFKEEMGSFSDISIIAPALKTAAVNLSAGYYEEHTRHEFVDLRAIEKNVERIGKMVSTATEKFDYIEALYFHRGLWGGYYEDIPDLERYYHEVNEIEIMALMPLPDTAHVKTPNGDREECEGQYLLDSTGKVYEFLYDLDAAVERHTLEARSEHGMPVRFKEQEAMEVEVISMEFMFDDYGYCG